MTEHTNVKISEICTFKHQGVLPKLTLIETLEDLKQQLQTTPNTIVIGKGSNTLLSPNTTHSIIQLSSKMTPIKIDETTLQVPAGISGNKCLSLCKQNGITGLEFFAGVPTTMGGMCAMNFGCWGHEIKEHITKVRMMNNKGEERWFNNDEMKFEYRSSIVQGSKWIIIEVCLKGEKAESEIVEKNINESIAKRLQKQPLRDNTFGSIFKNPPDHKAGKLIEESNLKGKKIGGAMVSKHHANFMINTGTATYEDACKLIEHIISTVKQNTGILLEPEVKRPL